MSAINAADRSGYVKRTPDETLVASVLAEFHMVGRNFKFIRNCRVLKSTTLSFFLTFSFSTILFLFKFECNIVDNLYLDNFSNISNYSNFQRINKSYMSIIKRSVSNLARSLTAGMPLFKSKIELCVPQIVLTPSLADMQVFFRGSGNVAHLYSLI